MSKQGYVELVLLIYLGGFIMKTYEVGLKDWQFWVLHIAGSLAIFFICDEFFKDQCMKVRLAKKIILGRSECKNEYWLGRVVRSAFGWKEDHRVVKALRTYHRKAIKKRGGKA